MLLLGHRVDTTAGNGGLNLHMLYRASQDFNEPPVEPEQVKNYPQPLTVGRMLTR